MTSRDEAQLRLFPLPGKQDSHRSRAETSEGRPGDLEIGRQNLLTREPGPMSHLSPLYDLEHLEEHELLAAELRSGDLLASDDASCPDLLFGMKTRVNLLEYFARMCELVSTVALIDAVLDRRVVPSRAIEVPYQRFCLYTLQFTYQGWTAVSGHMAGKPLDGVLLHEEGGSPLAGLRCSVRTTPRSREERGRVQERILQLDPAVPIILDLTLAPEDEGEKFDPYPGAVRWLGIRTAKRLVDVLRVAASWCFSYANLGLRAGLGGDEEWAAVVGRFIVLREEIHDILSPGMEFPGELRRERDVPVQAADRWRGRRLEELGRDA